MLGIGVLEIKFGYGLSVEVELKIFCVIKWLKFIVGIVIKFIFFGVYVFFVEFKEDYEGYICLIIEEMLLVIVVE